MLAPLMPYPRRFRNALDAARLAKPFAPVAAAIGLKRLAAMLQPVAVAPAAPAAGPANFAATGARQGHVAPFAGCVNDLLMPEINAATIGVLTRHGIEVVLPEGAGCCGSLVHHMGREAEALAQARANIDAWSAVDGLDAILITRRAAARRSRITATCCAAIRTTPGRRPLSGLAKEFRGISPACRYGPNAAPGPVVAYHSACSLQHGQRITRQPKELFTSSASR